MYSTHVNVYVCMYSTAAITMAEACFLAVTAMVQLLIQLEYVCVCVSVWGWGWGWGCKEVGIRVKRLTEETAELEADNTV